MRLEQRLSAAQVASIAIGGSLLLYANVWQADLMHYPQHAQIHGSKEFFSAAKWVFARLVPPIIIGIWMTYVAQAAFGRGLAKALWSDMALNKLRADLDSTVWTAAGYVMALTAVGFVVVDALIRLNGGRSGASGAGGFVFFCIMPLECLASLRQALRPDGDGPRNVLGQGRQAPILRPLAKVGVSVSEKGL